jgi:hypothetical protein
VTSGDKKYAFSALIKDWDGERQREKEGHSNRPFKQAGNASLSRVPEIFFGE